MPLVDPVTMSKENNPSAKAASGSGHQDNNDGLPLIDGKTLLEWQTELVGKTMGDENTAVTYSAKNLPRESRVVAPGTMTTMDHQPHRLTIYVDEDNIVHKVKQC